MIWRIEIEQSRGVFDSYASGIYKDICDLGLNDISKVEVKRIFNLLANDFTAKDVDKIARNLLIDPITQEYKIYSQDKLPKIEKGENFKIVEITYNPGVMDPVEQSTIKGIKDLGFSSIKAVHTAKQYKISGKINTKQLSLITDKVLCNKLIQHVVKDLTHNIFVHQDDSAKAVNVRIVDLIKASKKKLNQISKEGQLFLNIEEMLTIQDYFKKLKRNPTDCELETVAQTWSEHCFHKTFRGNIDFTLKENGKTTKTTIKNLLKTTIVKATTQVNKDWCVSVFHDNAGVIKFDSDSDVCFKVETHNHPSALEPFGGANTGIGGVIRDILGTGLGAKPICNTDVFCFAKPDMDFNDLPAGTLHPKRVMKGVVSGVRDYGNKMGIPTINGAVLFDDKFVGNPLVYCGTVGIMPKNKAFKKVNKGDYIVVVGGKTGRDGIHGATFSSGELTDESEVVSSGAVQIGDPIQEKKVLDALMQARDKNLYSAITDCGAGGLSSAIGEMGEKLGARVQLDKVPLKYKGLNYEEIWISESQERMVISVDPKNAEELLKVFADENVEATIVGEFTGSEKLELFYNGVQVCDLRMEFLHDGNPRITKKAVWEKPKVKDPKIENKTNLNEDLLNCLSHYNVCSKHWIIRQYDHEVQGASIIKPLVGKYCDGPSDASVIKPKFDSNRGIAVSNGINFQYGKIDPFWMSASCIDEAIRQIVCVGGNIDKIAILDNFCWGNPDKPDRLGGLVRAAQGCYKAAVSYKVPFISGKDSLYNEYAENNKSIAIPGTILISAIGIVSDVTKTVTMDFKRSGNLIYCVGTTFDELGGSIYYDTLGYLGENVPKVNFTKGLQIFSKLNEAVNKGLISSMHDCSEGGLAVSLAEMAFSGGFGVTVNLNKVPGAKKINNNQNILFSESNTRFLVEVEPSKVKKFEDLLKSVNYGLIGKVEATPEFLVYGKSDEVCINLYIDDMKKAWSEPLDW